MKKKSNADLAFIESSDSKKSNKVINSAQNAIPFKELYENGMILLDSKNGNERYAMCFSFTNTNYTLLKDSDKIKKVDTYKAIFNSLSPDIHYQELYINVPVDESKYLNVVAPADADISTPYAAAYFDNQKQFIKDITQDISDKAFYIALSYQKKSALDMPLNILMQAYRTISDKLQEIGSECNILNPVDIMSILHEIYNPFDENGFILPKNMYARGMHIRDYIAPSALYFKPHYIAMGDCFSRTFFVKTYADDLDDEFISHLMNNRFKVVVAKHVDHIDKDIALSQITSRLKSLETERQTRNMKNKKAGTDYIPADLKEEIETCNQLKSDIKSREELFDVSIYINVAAKTQADLEDISKIIIGSCREHLVSIQNVAFRQKDALSSVLPFAYDRLGLSQYFLSSSLGVTIPFSYSKSFSPDGFHYGRNTISGTPVIISRKNDKNGNGFYMGKPGSGKSIFAKMEINDVFYLTKNDRIIVIDPEKEFVKQCNALGGQVIKISPTTKNFINPFDIDNGQEDTEDIIKSKFELIISLFEVFKSNKLTAQEISVADRCIKFAYKDYLVSGRDKDKLPTFKEYYNFLKEQPEDEAKQLSLYLELYVFGSVDIFSHRTNVQLDTRFTSFDLSELGENLKKAGMLIVLDFIWKEIMNNFQHSIYTWLYADEFHMFYNEDEDKNSAGRFFERVFARCRKYGGLATGITQNATGILQSKSALSMLQNSQFVVLFEQAKSNLNILADLYELSEAQKAKLYSPKIGQGILISQNIAIPFDKKYPDNNIVYDTITTNFKDKLKAI